MRRFLSDAAWMTLAVIIGGVFGVYSAYSEFRPKDVPEVAEVELQATVPMPTVVVPIPAVVVCDFIPTEVAEDHSQYLRTDRATSDTHIRRQFLRYRADIDHWVDVRRLLHKPPSTLTPVERIVLRTELKGTGVKLEECYATRP